MARRTTRGSRRPAARRVSEFSHSSPWAHIEEFIDDGGNISIGPIEPVECAAIANDRHNMLAELVRRDGETSHDLLRRLDQAVDRAMNHDAYTDEINAQ